MNSLFESKFKNRFLWVIFILLRIWKIKILFELVLRSQVKRYFVNKLWLFNSILFYNIWIVIIFKLLVLHNFQESKSSYKGIISCLMIQIVVLMVFLCYIISFILFLLFLFNMFFLLLFLFFYYFIFLFFLFLNFFHWIF